MSLAWHEQRALRRIDRALERSAPRMHAEFWVFGNKCSGQVLPGWEQLPPGAGRLWPTVQRRIAHGTLLALRYAGEIAWPPDNTDGQVGQQAGK